MLGVAPALDMDLGGRALDLNDTPRHHLTIGYSGL